jgi:hypothetical protein
MHTNSSEESSDTYISFSIQTYVDTQDKINMYVLINAFLILTTCTNSKPYITLNKVLDDSL